MMDGSTIKPNESILVDRTSVTATIELLGEESCELSFACIKLARLLRNENPVIGHTLKDLLKNMHEEIGDVVVVLDEMTKAGLIDEDMVDAFIKMKRERMETRLPKKEDENNAKTDT